MPLESGSILPASVGGVERGAAGDPGQLNGVFDTSQTLGTLWANTSGGVFGTLSGASPWPGQAVEVAPRMRWRRARPPSCAIFPGEQVEEYEIQIEKILSGERDGLPGFSAPGHGRPASGGHRRHCPGHEAAPPSSRTGGWWGAVTHVMVDDPACGYGIWAGRMLRQCGLE